MRGFSALQRAENSSIVADRIEDFLQQQVSVLFSEPKIPQSVVEGTGAGPVRPVSVLFSEPKIPQSAWLCSWRPWRVGFSALQRAENSSMRIRHIRSGYGRCFSALQRAENSSINKSAESGETPDEFQCSSASRKFLNGTAGWMPSFILRVSVLFSEPKIPQYRACRVPKTR